MTTTRGLLLISYHFPPVGGSGVQRTLKYSKYLPAFGWKPYVLTVKSINYHVYDYSLLSEVPQEVCLLRTESLDPHRLSGILFRPPNSSDVPGGASRNRYFPEGSRLINAYRCVRDFMAFPDASFGWLPFAYRAGLRAIREHGISAIVASIPTYASAILAQRLAHRTGIPYVLDFRDGWTDCQNLRCPTRLHHWAHRAVERKIVSTADAVTVYGDYLANKLLDRYPMLADRISVLTNGFDPSDLQAAEPAKRREGWNRIVYSGSVLDAYSPNFRSVVSAVKALPFDIRATLEILFVGRVEVRGAREMITTAGLGEHIKLLGYRPHTEALGYLASSDASLLFLPIGDVSSYSGKVFEYMMVRRPIVSCIQPNSTCSDLLRSIGQSDYISHPADFTGLCQVITNLARDGWPRPCETNIDRFSRRHLTERLSQIVNTLVDSRSDLDSGITNSDNHYI